MDPESLRNTLQDALDDLSSTRASLNRKARALAALEHLLALVSVPSNSAADLEGFMVLQDTFECNVPSRLLSWISASTTKLETLTTNAVTDQDLETEITTISSQLAQSLYIIQGVSLHHKQSKRFLGRKYVLEIMLDLLTACRHASLPLPLTTTDTNTTDACMPARSQTQTHNASLTPLPSVVLDTLLCILVDAPTSLRAFEDCHGVQAVVKVLKTVGTAREVRMKCLEFLYFYLMDERSSQAGLDGIQTHTAHHSTPEPTSPIKTTSFPRKRRLETPFSPTQTVPSTPTHTRSCLPASSSLSTNTKSMSFTPNPKSSSSGSSDAWGSISSDLSSSTSSSTPESASVPLTKTQTTPKTPPKSIPILLPSLKTPQRPRVLVLPKDVDIDYEPISPKKPKPKIARVGTISNIPGNSKVRALRELSTGSKSMPTISNNGTPSKNPFGTPRHAVEREIGRADEVRSAEEKKEILGKMLGNVDALVEGVRKAGIWGLESGSHFSS